MEFVHTLWVARKMQRPAPLLEDSGSDDNEVEHYGHGQNWDVDILPDHVEDTLVYADVCRCMRSHSIYQKS